MQMRLLAIAVAILPFCAACHRAADGVNATEGRRVFLQSEVAIDKVKSFRAHIEMIAIDQVATDAEYDCDRVLAHFVEINERLQTKVEFIDTQGLRFSRQVTDPPSKWNSVRHIGFSSVCGRLRTGGQDFGEQRRFSADQSRIVPPFFFYANEPGAVIMPVGKDTVGAVDCEMWRVKDNVFTFPLHTIWIGVADRLPRKYVEGELDNPQGVVTYSDYGEHIDIQVPST